MKSQTQTNEKAKAIVELIELAQIDEPKTAQRFALVEDETRELAESIEELGLIEPIVVKRIGKRFEVIAGHRRLEAHRILKRKTIEAKVLSCDARTSEKMKMHENYKRLSLSANEEAIYFNSLICEHSWKQNEIAGALGVSEAYVSQRLAVLDWPACLLAAMETGAISFSAARELARITEDSALEMYVKAACENGVTPRVAGQWFLDWAKSQDFANQEPHEDSNAPVTRDSNDIRFDCYGCGESFSFREMVYARICCECQKDFAPIVAAKRKERRRNGKA